MASLKGRVSHRVYKFDSYESLYALAGDGGQNLKRIEQELGVSLQMRGLKLMLCGDQRPGVEKAASILNSLKQMTKRGKRVDQPLLERMLQDRVSQSKQPPKVAVAMERFAPKNEGQRRYLEAIEEHDLTFGVGPAGTGKTYLAVASAVQALTAGTVKKIILTRPAVEAGENLGFLPGGLQDKIDPYLRPLYDAMEDLLGKGRVDALKRDGIIEVAPLAFMRGRTISNAFVILDEAQNCTPMQIKMLLTRIGFGTKCVVTGDRRQSDLRGPSGLSYACQALKDVPGINITEFFTADVVRHPLVAKIVTALDRFEGREGQDNPS